MGSRSRDLKLKLRDLGTRVFGLRVYDFGSGDLYWVQGAGICGLGCGTWV